MSAAGSIFGSLAGSYLTGRSNEKAAETNAAIQRELAQNGLSWRIADAKKAGINPLAALGASIPSGSPVAVGTDFGDLGLGKAGQDISRAMKSGMTREQRELHDLNKEMLQTQIEGMKIDNRQKMTGTPPPLPSPGNTYGGVNDILVDVIKDSAKTSKQPGVLAATQPKFVDYIDETGELERKLNSDLMEAQEDDPDTKIRSWTRLLKEFTGSHLSQLFYPDYVQYSEEMSKKRPPHPQKGWEYRWNRDRRTWVPHKLKPGEKSRIFDKETGVYDKWYRKRKTPWTMENYIDKLIGR